MGDLTVFSRWRGVWLARVYLRVGRRLRLVNIIAGEWGFVQKQIGGAHGK